MAVKVGVFKIPMSSPADISGLKELVEKGSIEPEEVVAVLGKTEGNGCVNDFTRGYATDVFAGYLAGELGKGRDEILEKVAFIMSGGTEGVMSPHATIFTRSSVEEDPKPGKRLSIGVAFTRAFLPEEQGRMPVVLEVAGAVRRAMEEARIGSTEDVHFVQIKCPLLTSDRIREAQERGRDVCVDDTYKSMGFNRGASALGVAVALNEIPVENISDEDICKNWSLYSGVASASAGVELLNCEILVMGNSPESASDYRIGHSVMADGIDAKGVMEALRSAGLDYESCAGQAELSRIVNVFAKAEAPSTGQVRGRRNTMLEDSDINHTRSARAVVNAVIASIIGDPMVYVSGGAEHQGPDGGGPVAAIASL